MYFCQKFIGPWGHNIGLIEIVDVQGLWQIKPLKAKKNRNKQKDNKKNDLKASAHRHKSKLKRQRYGTSVLMGVMVEVEALFMQRC